MSGSGLKKKRTDGTSAYNIHLDLKSLIVSSRGETSSGVKCHYSLTLLFCA